MTKISLWFEDCMTKSSNTMSYLQIGTMSKVSGIKVLLCSFSSERLDRLLFAISPVVKNMHSTGTNDDDEDKCSSASGHRSGYMPTTEFFLQKSSISSSPTLFVMLATWQLPLQPNQWKEYSKCYINDPRKIM